MSAYGFVGSIGRSKLTRPLTSLNLNTTASFNHTLQATESRGAAYTGLYGWMRPGAGAPEVEYYIVENWYGSRPRDGDWVKTITVDQRSYDVYHRLPRAGAPMHQWWSVAQTQRSSGTISYVKHFDEWKKANGGAAISDQLKSISFFLEPQTNSGGSHGKVEYSSYSIGAP